VEPNDADAPLVKFAKHLAFRRNETPFFFAPVKNGIEELAEENKKRIGKLIELAEQPAHAFQDDLNASQGGPYQ
jgi:hypothetical protein